MAGIITVGNDPRRYLPGVNSWYGYQYSLWPEEYSVFLDQQRTEKAYEDKVSMAGMDVAVVKTESQSISYDDFKQGIPSRFVPIMYGKGFVISKEAIDDDLY